MTDQPDFIAREGQAFHCLAGHYVCRLACDIPNDPGFAVSLSHFKDWAPGIAVNTLQVPSCHCGSPWLMFSSGDLA